MRALQLTTACAVTFFIHAAAAQAGNINIAGGSTPSASGPGFGAGTSISDIIDGNQFYTDTNAHGLALPFTTSGIQWIELDFGADQIFDMVTMWHHFTNRIPPTAMLEYWDGGAWNDIAFSREVPVTIYDGIPGNSASDEYTFAAVTGSKVRWSYDSAVMFAATQQHAWIYEMEVFSPVPEPTSLALLSIGACVAGIGAARRRR